MSCPGLILHRLAHSSLVRQTSAVRHMASGGRSYYIKDGSNPTNITDEIRDLVKNQKHAENVHEWKRGVGIGDPVRLDNKDDKDRDDDQMPDVVYFPHKGDDFVERSKNYKASPVLLVKRLKPLAGQPYWHKETCERLGIGFDAPADRLAVLPNLPSTLTRLYTIKHLIEIIPVKFPKGLPKDEVQIHTNNRYLDLIICFNFDPSACRINHKGEFYYHPELKQDSRTVVSVESQSEMKVSQDMIVQEARKHWFTPWNTPLGNSNYHRKYGHDHSEKFDHVSDPKYKKRFS